MIMSMKRLLRRVPKTETLRRHNPRSVSPQTEIKSGLLDTNFYKGQKKMNR
jgi:hypothetical protein